MVVVVSLLGLRDRLHKVEGWIITLSLCPPRLWNYNASQMLLTSLRFAAPCCPMCQEKLALANWVF